METTVDSPAPRDAQRSGATPKKGDADVVRPPSRMVLLQDLIAAFKAPGYWLFGAWIDTNVRYRSQALGAFWMVSGTLLFVLLLGTLYSRVLRESSPIYYAYLATGIVLWNFIQQSIQQSTRLFKKNASMIENGYVKYVDYILRTLTGGLINLGYNLLIVVGAIALTPVEITAAYFVLILTIPLLLVLLVGICVLFSVLGARYPDIPELVQTILRVSFFLTPIIWMKGALAGKGAIVGAFIYLNPFYYMLEIIRGPVVQAVVPWFEIGVVAAAALVIWLAAGLAYARAKPYIPLWI